MISPSEGTFSNSAWIEGAKCEKSLSRSALEAFWFQLLVSEAALVEEDSSWSGIMATKFSSVLFLHGYLGGDVRDNKLC